MYQNIFVTHYEENSPSTIYLWDDGEGLTVIPYNKGFRYAYKPDPRGTYQSIYGEPLKKVSRWKDGEHVFESDVGKEVRVLTDLYMDSDEMSDGHIIGYFDIECSTIGGFPDISIANKEITAISFYNSKTELYDVFLLDPKKKVRDHATGNVDIKRYDTEAELLTDFLEWYATQKFTILTGWNSDRFDIPYLYRRLSAILGETKANGLSPVGIVRWAMGRDCYQIAGVSCLDYLIMYKKFTYSERPNYRLNTIGLLEVNMGKVEYEGNLDDLFETDIDKFVEYNLTDVKIVVELDHKLKLIDLVRNICHVGHVPYEDYQYPSRFIEGTILTYLHKKNIICPNKPVGGQEQLQAKINSDDEGFKGAYVKPPVPGLYEWVYSLDLQSLYPSIIMSLNISPETKMGRVLNYDAPAHSKNKMDKYVVDIETQVSTMTRDEFLKFMDDFKLNISSNGILYSTDQVGIIPEILDIWFKQRLAFKALLTDAKNVGDAALEEYYDRRQHVQKIFLNSVYGILGLPIFRFYDLDNALAVTSSGQDIIKLSAKYVNNAYINAGIPNRPPEWVEHYQEILNEDAERRKTPSEIASAKDHCVYIDTDSLYFSAVPFIEKEGGDPLTVSIAFAKQMEAELNSFYDVMAHKMFCCKEHRLVIKGEKVTRTALWVIKKRYALLQVYDLDKNEAKEKIIVKGLDIVRSTFPPAFAQFMSKILKDILYKATKSDIDSQVLTFKDSLVNIDYLELAKNVAVKDLKKYDTIVTPSYNTFAKGAPAHVKAALTYNRFLINNAWHNTHAIIRSGDKIKWVYLSKNPYDMQTIAAKGYNDPPEVVAFIKEYIDYDTLFKKELQNKLQNFYYALHWGLIPTEVNQLASQFFDI